MSITNSNTGMQDSASIMQVRFLPDFQKQIVLKQKTNYLR